VTWQQTDGTGYYARRANCKLAVVCKDWRACVPYGGRCIWAKQTDANGLAEGRTVTAGGWDGIRDKVLSMGLGTVGLCGWLLLA